MAMIPPSNVQPGRNDGWIMFGRGYPGQTAAESGNYIAAFDWIAERISRHHALAKKIHHRLRVNDQVVLQS